jgi:hypothetical protein
VEEGGASGAEGGEGLEGGGTQGEVHGVKIERNRKRAVTSGSEENAWWGEWGVGSCKRDACTTLGRC